jgi:hypothetical protein
MKFRLVGDWPVTSFCVPAGTELDGEAPTWGGQPLPLPMPVNALALDEEAALQMAMSYEESASIGGWHSLHFAAGIDREAILAQARHNKQWPNGPPALKAEEKPARKRK